VCPGVLEVYVYVNYVRHVAEEMGMNEYMHGYIVVCAQWIPNA
jgi:hypothetical protein